MWGKSVFRANKRSSDIRCSASALNVTGGSNKVIPGAATFLTKSSCWKPHLAGTGVNCQGSRVNDCRGGLAEDCLCWWEMSVGALETFSVPTHLKTRRLMHPATGRLHLSPTRLLALVFHSMNNLLFRKLLFRETRGWETQVSQKQEGLLCLNLPSLSAMPTS